MTVTYTAEVATCRGFGCFLKLLFRWRGSIYKLVWLDLICFLFMYYFLNIIYRVVLNDEHKLIFESIVKYCATYSNLIPLSFVLGFYVTVVMTRWWNQYTSIPWPDSFAVFVSANIHGLDERGRLMRRNVMRYVCLCLTMVLSNISPRVKKRFPTLTHLVAAGLLEENERIIMENFMETNRLYSKHWMPIVWASSIITRARKEGRIHDDFAVKTLIDELNQFRGKTGTLIAYDTISIPLVYTQVVTLAVYSFFITSMMGQQWVENKAVQDGVVNHIDMYFPIFTTLQFFFYMGWLKVAESLINPFGEDDDDFEVNWIIDRNLKVSYMIVDEMHHEHPELIKDQYWDSMIPNELPYTEETEAFREQHPQPSTANIELPKKPQMRNGLGVSLGKDDEMVGKSALSINNYKFPEIDVEGDDTASGIHFTAGRRASRTRMGSTTSMHSSAGSVTRVNSVANVLKRFFSRDEARSPTQTLETPPLDRSASGISLAGTGKFLGTGTMRITDQVIEELDEQTTIHSIRGSDKRPTAQSIFAKYDEKQPIRSEPIDMPNSHHTTYTHMPYDRAESVRQSGHRPYEFSNDEVFSTSAPDERSMHPQTQTPTINVRDIDVLETPTNHEPSKRPPLAPQEDVDCTTSTPKEASNSDDDFEQLRILREKERIERQKQKIARSVSQQTGGSVTLDTDLLLEHLVGSKSDGLNRHSYYDPNA